MKIHIKSVFVRVAFDSIFSPLIDCLNLKITTIILWDRTKYGILSMVD